MPLVLGPVRPTVVYPTENALIASRDSNFIFGAVGNGRASLTINGASVPVLPNGSYLAFLPNPPQNAPRYDLVASLGGDTVRLTRSVRLLPPVPALPLTGPLVVDSASLEPSTRLSLRDDEPVRVSLRAPSNAAVWVEPAAGVRMPLVRSPAAREAGSGPAGERGDAGRWATDVPARLLRGGATLFAARGADTVRLSIARVAPALGAQPRMVALDTGDSTASDTDRVVIGRPSPGGTYKWFLLPGTRVEATGQVGRFTRVRLDGALEIWMNEGDVTPLPAGTPAPRRIARNARVVPAAGWTDVIIPMAERPPFLVEEGERELTLTLYGTTSAVDIVNYAPGDSLVQLVQWTQPASDRVRITLRLSSAPYGYLPLWTDQGFVLRVRRPPVVSRHAPLRGLLIAVDAGHPPIGATGPTGLYEPIPALAIAQRLRALLEERGAAVVMTRTTDAPVALGSRPILARRTNANALVSVHLNALPDGVNPFTTNGTGTYFFRPQAEPLARTVQRGMVRRLELRDLGINYDNLALARPTWMPAILCEGAFIMMPKQEAALRTPGFQEAYARGIADGLEAYFRSLAVR